MYRTCLYSSPTVYTINDLISKCPVCTVSIFVPAEVFPAFVHEIFSQYLKSCWKWKMESGVFNYFLKKIFTYVDIPYTFA